MRAVSKFSAFACIGAFLIFGRVLPTIGGNSDPKIQAIPVEVFVPFSPSPVRAEGQKHLLYELHITNFGKTDLQLMRVDVLAARNGAFIQSIAGPALASAVSEPGQPKPKDASTLMSGRRMVVFMDVRLPDTGVGLSALENRLVFSPVTTINLDQQSVVDSSSMALSTQDVPILGPPLRGGCWVASHALSNDSSHRRTLIALNGRVYGAQRYAIDWIRIGSDGQAFRGNDALNRNWSAYDADVLAVADGTVLEARDGIPENDPTSDRNAVGTTV